MGQTLSDFSALKGLKKEMEKQEQAASPKPVIEQKKPARYSTGPLRKSMPAISELKKGPKCA